MCDGDLPEYFFCRRIFHVFIRRLLGLCHQSHGLDLGVF